MNTLEHNANLAKALLNRMGNMDEAWKAFCRAMQNNCSFGQFRCLIEQANESKPEQSAVIELSNEIVNLPDGNEEHMACLQEVETGHIFYIHASYIEQEVDTIQSPYGNGELNLLDEQAYFTHVVETFPLKDQETINNTEWESYTSIEQIKTIFESNGYTFDFDLGSNPYGLRKLSNN